MTEVLSGYKPESPKLAAQQVTRGGKTVYIVAMPIALVPEYLRIPEVNKPDKDNRQVSKAHAEEFGLYWRDNPNSWTVPPLLVDCSETLEFKPDYQIEDGPALGKVTLPNYANRVLRTLDGQHRIYGWSFIRAQIFEDLAKAKSDKLIADKTGTDIEKQLANRTIQKCEEALDRMKKEQITLEIITMVSEVEHKTFFVDIADGALGINPSERARLDEKHMTSRVAKMLTDQIPLLQNRVELRKSTASKTGKDLMSLANLRDITRHVCFGIVGKVTESREAAIKDSNAFEISQHFVNALIESSQKLGKISDGSYEPSTLKFESLLGSMTIWRCLAGAYHELAVEVVDNKSLRWKESGHEKFVTMATAAINKMQIVEKDGQRTLNAGWYQTDCFNPSGLSPLSRTQDLKGLTNLFVAWAESGQVFQPASLAKI